MRRGLLASGIVLASTACATGGTVTGGSPDAGDADAGMHLGEAGGADSGASGVDAPSDDALTSADGGCDPMSCLSGCCQLDGTCAPGTAPTACGNGGNYCIDCTKMNLGCVSHGCGVATCSGCTGCCATGSCVAGLSDQACGKGGQPCVDCSSQSLACVNGYCQ